MSRNITSDTALRLTSDAGQDPFPVVKLTLGTQVYWFSDRDQVQDGLVLEGRIKDIGPLQTDIRIDKAGRAVGSVATVDLTLLDEDKVLLGLLDANDFQGAQVILYQWFTGQVQADLLVTLKGRIEVAPVWVEKDRTLTITAETPRRVNPVPFAPTEADDLDVDLDHLGETWPLCFGRPSDVPAVLVKDAPRGTLVQDMTQSGQIEDQDDVAVEVATNVFEIDNPDEDFPQDVTCLVKVGDEYMTGTFDGNTLTVVQRRVNHYTGLAVSGTGAEITVPAGVRCAGQYIIIRDPSVVPAYSPNVGTIHGTDGVARYTTVLGSPVAIGSADFVGYCYRQVGRTCYIWNGNPTYIIQNAVADVNKYPNDPADGARWVHKAGSPVVVASVNPVWIANMIPSDRVIRVRAYRQVTHDDHSGFSQNRIVKVPRGVYTVNLNDAAYNGATTITMDEFLSDRESGWSDELYVTLESSQDENTARAIKYLLDNHSEGSITTDATSFAAVATKLENYPSHFAILAQSDVLDLVGDIAWQARCGLVWNGSDAKITYLSEEPTAQAMDLTDENVGDGSISLTTTPIEDIVTVFNVEWRPNYSDRKPKRLLYRTNVARYGKREQKYVFSIYQHRKCVKKSADFWSMRLGRLWRKAEAQHWGLEGLMLDPLDYARWQIDEFLVPVRGLVTETKFQDQAYTSVCATLPIEAGTMEQSTHFWMDDSDDTAPSVSSYTGGADGAEEEIIEAPPPEVLVMTAPEQTVFSVVANADELRNPAATGWKTVEVRILDPKETEARDGKLQNTNTIAEIDAQDPDHVNSTLNAQRQALVAANLDLDAYIQTYTDHPELVTARNPSSLYMNAGDFGTMIKVPGGEYIVTPANASGPFVVRINKPPASPAEGIIYGDAQGTMAAGPTGTQQILVLGDGSGIRVGDLVLVFRDTAGNYFTPGGGSAGQVAVGVCFADHLGGEDVPLVVYYGASLGDDVREFVSATCPGLDDAATLPAGTWGPAVKLDGDWVFMPALYTTFVE